MNARLPDLDPLNVHVDTLERALDEFLERKCYLVDQVRRNGIDVYTMLENDIETDEDALFIGRNDNALAQW